MDKTTITCLCDNTVKYSSTYWGEHGISFLIEAGERTVLFDTGQSYPVLAHNAAAMKKELTHVGDVIISHGHYDHTGGLSGLLSLCNPTTHAHPLIFEKKYQVYDGVNPTYIGMPTDRDTIESRSKLSLDKGSVEVTSHIRTTGEVPRNEPTEEVPERFKRDDGGTLVYDPILDDQSVIVDNGSEAIVLLGCTHSGLVNTIKRCKELTDLPISAVAGGTHLVNAPKERLERTVGYLKDEGIRMYGFHCTGLASAATLRSCLGRDYDWGFVGWTYEL